MKLHAPQIVINGKSALMPFHLQFRLANYIHVKYDSCEM